MFGLFKKKPKPRVRPIIAELIKLMGNDLGWEKDTEHSYTRLMYGSNIWVYPNGEATFWGTPKVTIFVNSPKRACLWLPLNKAERRMIRSAGEVLEKRLRSNAAIEWESQLKAAEQLIMDARPTNDTGGDGDG